jgi:hypothetical protein
MDLPTETNDDWVQFKQFLDDLQDIENIDKFCMFFVFNMFMPSPFTALENEVINYERNYHEKIKFVLGKNRKFAVHVPGRLFSNYNSGEITNYNGNVYVTATNTDGSSLNDCIVIQSTVIPDPMPTPVLNDCGCPNDGDDDSLSICVSSKIVPPTQDCKNLVGTNITDEGYVIFTQKIQDANNNTINFQTEFVSQECCKTKAGGVPQYYNLVVNDKVVNSGYLCCSPQKPKCGCFISCNWKVLTRDILLPIYPPNVTGPQSSYLQFIRPDGTTAVVTSDGSHCLGTLNTLITPTPNVTDPLTGEIGVGCKLNTAGISDLNSGVNNSAIINTYEKRYQGLIPCC